MTTDHITFDRRRHNSDAADAPTFFTTEKLGPKRYKTPEGFLVCQEVPIARIGVMEYGPNEVPQELGIAADGKVHIVRTEEEIFNPLSIASIAGKPVADDHPPVDVTPENWKFYTKGVVMHPRRGGEDLSDLLVADLMIWDPEMIADVEEGKREVSCGYDPRYYPVLDNDKNEIPGWGEQRRIIYNHLALVGRGRCGPRCAIGDRKTVDSPSKEVSKMGWRERLRVAFTSKDTAAFDAALASVDRKLQKVKDAEPHHIEVHNHIPGGAVGSGSDEPSETEEMAERIKEAGKKKDAMPEGLAEHIKSSDERFKAVEDGMKGLRDAMTELGSGLKKFFEEEGKEPVHSGDNEEEESADEEMMTDRDEEEGVKDENEPPPKHDDTRKILGELEFEAPPGTSDKARKAKDSIYLQDAFQDTVSKAEMLVPGIRLPTFDRAAPPAKTLKQIQGLRRMALDLAYVKPDMRGLIDSAMGGRTLDTARTRPDQLRTLFNAVAAVSAQTNSNRVVDATGIPAVGMPIKARMTSLADINTRNRQMFGTKRAG